MLCFHQMNEKNENMPGGGGSAHLYNSSTQKAEAGGSLRSRPAWSARASSGQAPKSYRETLSQKNKKQTNKKEGAKEQGEEGNQGPPSHPASHEVRVKVRYTEVRKGKSPEEKGSWDNLRKAGKFLRRSCLFPLPRGSMYVSLGVLLVTLLLWGRGL